MTVASETLGSRVKALLGVEAGEERTVGLMAALYFVLAVAFVFVQTTAFGLFIGEYGSRNLPFAYLTIALIASGIAYLYLWLQERLDFKTLLFVNLAFLAVVSLIFWVGLRSPLGHSFVFFLPFWFQTLLNLANLLVWSLAGRMFDVRQAKRLFGLVGTGTWLANILGGLVIASILAFSGTSNPYLFAAIAVLAAAVVLWVIFRLRLVPASAAALDAASDSQAKGKPAASPFASPYNRLIFAMVLLWWVAFYFVDNIFLDRAGVQFHSAAEVAAFIGRQLSVVGVIALITSTFLTGRIIRRFGVRIGLLVMPVVVAFCALLVVVGGIVHAPAAYLFWFAAAAQTFNLALGFSISQSSGSLLYQPILGAERNRTQTIAEGIVQPAAIGVAGLLLLLFNTTLHLNAVGLSAIFLPICAVWLWIILRVSAAYPQVLSEALVKRALGDTTTLFFDPAGIAQLERSLKSPQAGPALYALNQLEQLQPDAWKTTLAAALPDLLAHPVPEVRMAVLGRIFALRLANTLPVLRGRLQNESDPQVYAMTVQILAALDDQSAEQIKMALASSERVVRQRVLIGLLSSADASKVESAKSLIDQLVESTDADDHLMAADILDDALCPGSSAAIRKLLTDPSVAVRQVAVRAAGRQLDASLIQDVVAACSLPETARVAEAVLVSKGELAVPAILAALSNSAVPLPAEGALTLVRTLGSIGGKPAANALEGMMDRPDAELRLAVLRALSSCGYHMRPAKRILDHLKPEIEEAVWLTNALETLAAAPASRNLDILSDALASALRDVRHRVLVLLSFGKDARSTLRALKALDEAGDNPPAFAIEAVDALLPAAWKPLVLPLIEDDPPAQRLDRWKAAGLSSAVPSVEALVEELVAPESGGRFTRWVTLCAVHASGALKLQAVLPALQTLSSAPDRTLADLCCWSLAQMGSAIPEQGEAVMLSLVEKVLALKSTSLFRETPDAVLADVAGRMDEVTLERDETLFHKGDPGDSLYIIVSGKVDLRDGERRLSELTDGGMFGELALLDPTPRSATAKALESAHLLQLNQSHFGLVLAERPEVATAIIHVLTSYIRTLLGGTQRLGAGVKDAEAFEA